LRQAPIYLLTASFKLNIWLVTQLKAGELSMKRIDDKRQRILTSAKALIHKQGYHQTTLAQIAENSEITIGNIYYYFKTKKQIIKAIIDERTDNFMARAQQWEKDPDPKNRLLSFLEIPSSNEKAIAKYGCSIGSLLQELNKTDEVEPDLANKTLQVQIDWVTEQFRLMGSSNPQEQAHHFIATIQGGCLLANSMKNPDMLHLQLKRLKEALVKEGDAL
jgi:AcrR family transcriptional regulator